MFLSSIAYDYYKGFVTAFIEINGQPETIFGKPPMKIVAPVVNSAALFETLCWLLFSLLLIVHLAVGSTAFNIFFALIPVLVLFAVFLVAMVLLYAYFTLAMFRFAKSIPWILAFVALLPVVFVNVLILFGMPIAFCVVLALGRMDILEDTRIFVPNLLMGIGLLGAVLKGFIRPTEDEENPYSQNRRTILDILLYLVFILFLEMFLFLIAMKVDGTIPFTTIAFDLPSWGIVFAPVILGELMAIVYFAVKAFFEWKLVIKQKDPNGNGWFRGVCFVTMIVFIVILIVGEVIVTVNEDLALFSPIFSLIPFPIALLLIVGMFVLPFADYTHRRVKKKLRKSETKKQKVSTKTQKVKEEEAEGVPLEEKGTDSSEGSGDKDEGEEKDKDIESPAEEENVDDDQPKPVAIRKRIMMHCFL